MIEGQTSSFARFHETELFCSLERIRDVRESERKTKQLLKKQHNRCKETGMSLGEDAEQITKRSKNADDERNEHYFRALTPTDIMCIFL